jgi:hypothetical protein
VTKPAAGTALNTGSAFYSGLVNVYGFLEGAGTTIADSKGGNNGTTHDGSWSTDAYGPVWATTHNGVAQPISLASVINNLGTDGRGPYSVAFRFKTTTLNSTSILMGAQGQANLFWPNGGNYLHIRGSGGDGPAFTDPAVINGFTTAHDYIFTWNGTGLSNQPILYVDGTQYVSPGIDPGHAMAMPIDTISAYGLDTGYELSGYVSYIYFWNNRVLSPSEAITFAANPFQIFDASPSSGMFSQAIGVDVMGLS